MVAPNLLPLPGGLTASGRHMTHLHHVRRAMAAQGIDTDRLAELTSLPLAAVREYLAGSPAAARTEVVIAEQLRIAPPADALALVRAGLLRKRYDGQPLSAREVAMLIGCTRQQVCEIEQAALRKLRRALACVA